MNYHFRHMYSQCTRNQYCTTLDIIIHLISIATFFVKEDYSSSVKGHLSVCLNSFLNTGEKSMRKKGDRFIRNLKRCVFD